MKPNPPMYRTKAEAEAAGHGNPSDQIEVTTQWGYMLVADTSDLCVPGLSLGARGLAALARGIGHTPSIEEVAALTGESATAIRRYKRELAGTAYLEWEE